MPTNAQTVLDFWFGAPDSADYGAQRDYWFKKDAQFDELIRERFLATYRAATAGELDAWRSQAASALALTIVLDQFPRNMFRDTPQAFASDVHALALARNAIERGFDQQLPPLLRWFFYLPFEHAEDIEAQKACLALTERLRSYPETADCADWAYKHLVIIERFGRFPHRNRILGRPTTAEEAEFLTQPGSSF